MAVNYGVLGGFGGGAGSQALNTIGGLQGLAVNQQALNARLEQQQAAKSDAMARQQAVDLLKSNNTDAIAEFAITNPTVMKDFITAANFKDGAAAASRVQYAKDVISGNVDPREALTKRIEAVTASGGDPQGLIRTMQGSDEDIIKAAEKDLAVMDPESYKSYRTTLPKAADGLKPTTKMQDFAKYQSLKETDPESALQFGVAAGFVDKATGIEETPASVRETEWFLKQTPEVQAQHIKLKRKTDPTMAEKLELEQSKSDIKVDEEGKKQTVKGIATRQQGYIDSGVEAADAIGNAYKVRELLETVGTGGFENAALAAKRLFGIESADEAQLSAGLGKAILSQLKPIFGAAFTEQEGKRLEKIEANFGKSTAGNKRLIGDVIKITERAANRGIRAAEAQGDKFAADEIRSALDAIKKVDKESPPDQEVTEGTVIQNPTTGEQLILQGGQWVTYNG